MHAGPALHDDFPKTAERRRARSMALIPAGAEAPDFRLPNQDGRPVARGDFAGRRVLLWWYPFAGSPG